MTKTRLTNAVLDGIDKAVAFTESDGEPFTPSDADLENIRAAGEWVEATRVQRGIEKEARVVASRLRGKR